MFESLDWFVEPPCPTTLARFDILCVFLIIFIWIERLSRSCACFPKVSVLHLLVSDFDNVFVTLSVLTCLVHALPSVGVINEAIRDDRIRFGLIIIVCLYWLCFHSLIFASAISATNLLSCLNRSLGMCRWNLVVIRSHLSRPTSTSSGRWHERRRLDYWIIITLDVIHWQQMVCIFHIFRGLSWLVCIATFQNWAFVLGGDHRFGWIWLFVWLWTLPQGRSCLLTFIHFSESLQNIINTG